MQLWSARMEDLHLGRRHLRGALALAALLLANALLLLPQPAAAQSAISAAQSRLNFDHVTTGFELIGQHRDLPCESCHVNAIFKGTPTDCGACHGIGTLVRATAKPKNHILSTDQCADCHTPVAWNPAFIVDHTQVRGSCSTCHNGTMAQGKGPTHIITDLECDACHTTLTWAGATFNHIGVTSGCATCHDNVHAMGVTATHVPIGTQAVPCESCHSPTNYTTWNPGVINHPAVSALTCASCHETANFQGMHPSTNTAAGDSRPPMALDRLHPATGDCALCHNTTSFLDPTTPRPSNHIPTAALCSQCHTTAGNWAVYSVTGTHQGVTGCLSCHGPSTGPFAGPPPGNTITIVGWPGGSHIPIGSSDCNGSGCHSTANVNPGGWKIGSASITTPTLTVAGHVTVAAGGVAGCMNCHESSPYMGMMASSSSAAGDSRPTAFDSRHPTTGECNSCHTTTPTFAADVTAGKPSNHVPTSAPCAQCHTTANDYTQYSSPGTHQGVSGCLSCHGSSVAGTFSIAANPVFSILTIPGNHIQFGTADCNGSGCHTTTNVTPGGGGFKIGTANISTPTLTVPGHATIAAAGVLTCSNCHETAPYMGMMPSSNTAAGDSRPSTTLDSKHPTTGDCGNCHVTSPTFAANLLPTAGKPSNHMPTTAPCAQCHTTVGNFATYSVAGVHQGVTGCLSCHGPSTGPFAGPPPSNTMTIVGFASTNHFMIGSADCNASGCHSTANVNAGGFKLGTASTSTPTLTVAGHATIASSGVAGCQGCHESAPYMGMMAGSSTAWGDSRPQAYDSKHPATGDCNGCHTTSPTFFTNQSGSSAKPSNHIPTTAPCAQCHTTAGSYVAYVMGATGHAGITNNCALCHAYGLSFYNMAAPTLKQPTAGATGHIPSNPPNGTGSIACELCHSPSNFTTFSGTIMRHAYVVSMTCMSCHERGMTWQTNAGVQLWTRPNGHHAGQDCGGSGCHNSRDKLALRPVVRPTTKATTPPASTSTSASKSASAVTARSGLTAPRPGTAAAPTGSGTAAGTGPFNHATVGGTACVSCHNGSNATGKIPTHIAATNACQSCHTTITWLPVRIVDHTQVIGTCISCHNGQIAAGKPPTHVATSAGCESCHTTNAWTPARFDHAAVAAHTCATCHNGVQATGRPRTHIATTQSCDVCHGTLAWKPAKVDHSTFASGCAACHNNLSAVGLPAGHMSTRIDCGTCHSYPDWAVLRFRHVSAAYPGNHRVALSCTSCHSSNTDQMPWRSPANAGSCAGCHAADFKPAAHPKTVKGQSYTVNELANCSGACHVYSDSTQSTITRSLPGPYHRVSDAAFKR
jgi:hypothetical protein